ncbi:MAG: TonB-dependent receptor plug domain-containing protein [Deltaproteobacteria bacterium]|jgi:iron complex outermembrane receptor protein|nr:TonB-dependent receptor plug domain-containing protein [Deltaproteobacteria bacterium]
MEHSKLSRWQDISEILCLLVLFLLFSLFTIYPPRLCAQDDQGHEVNAGAIQGDLEGEDPDLLSVLGEATEADNQIILTKEAISAMKVVKIHDALNQVPGVSATHVSVSIHGSNKVRVFVDGTPLNDPTAGHGSINFDMVSLQSVDRIIILKDSGGLRYGQDASAGVILIYTSASSQEKISGQLRAWYGNYSTFKTDTYLSFSLGAWGLSAKAGYESSNGYKVNNWNRLRRGGFKIARSFGEGKSFFFALDAMAERKGMSGYPETPTPFANQKSNNISMTLSGQWDGFHNNLYYNRGSTANWDHTRNLDQSLTVAEYGDSLTYSTNLGPVGITLGTGAVAIEADSKSFGRKRETVIHFFGAGSYKLGQLPLTVNAGLRYNINSDFENSLNPEFSLAFKKGIFEAVYKISKAVNTPTFQQRFNHSSSTIPNPELGIEKVTSQSLSLSLSPSDSFSISATYFYNILKNRISYVRPALAPVGQYQNLGESIYKGVDLGIAWNISPEVVIKARYTFLDAKDKELGLFISGQSRNYFNLEILLFPTEHFSTAIKADFRDRCFTDRLNQSKVAGRLLFSLRAEYDFGNVVLYLEGENLLDVQYKHADGLLGNPREVLVGVKLSF